MTDFSTLPQADQEAIGKTLLTLLKAFDERDAEPLDAVYSADADWVNAFGTVKRGHGEIVEYLRGLFKDADFNAVNSPVHRRPASRCSPPKSSSSRHTL